MAEYINRDLIVKNSMLHTWKKADLLRAIKEAPTADVEEVKHGEWLLLDECANEGVYCSVCRKKVYRTEYANQKIKSKFCPNCGARMDGKPQEKEGDFE